MMTYLWAYKDLKATRGSLGAAEMHARIQAERYAEAGLKIITNAELSGTSLTRFCPLTETEHQFLETAVKRLGLSARAYTRVLRIARSIAYLEGVERLAVEHLAEAIQYRTMDRQGQF